jgi:transcription elongation factor Elf1
MPDTPKIERCPYCGNKKYFDLRRKTVIENYIVCKECWSQGMLCLTEEKAIEAWNNVSSMVQIYLEMNPRADGSDNGKLSEPERYIETEGDDGSDRGEHIKWTPPSHLYNEIIAAMGLLQENGYVITRSPTIGAKKGGEF